MFRKNSRLGWIVDVYCNENYFVNGTNESMIENENGYATRIQTSTNTAHPTELEYMFIDSILCKNRFDWCENNRQRVWCK